MNAYLVRLRESHELVGIFVCARLDLFMAVDECCAATKCEAASLGAGGFIWSDSTNCTVPVKLPANEAEADIPVLPWAESELTEMWTAKICSEELRWFEVDVRTKNDREMARFYHRIGEDNCG